jgi:hypothetical protein
MRELYGLIAVWLISIVVAFVFGCIFVVEMAMPLRQFLTDFSTDPGGVAKTTIGIALIWSMVAAIVSLPVILFAAVPIYFFALKRRVATRGGYLYAGIGLGLLACVILYALQHSVRDFPSSFTGLEFPAILVTATIGTLIFSKIVHSKRIGVVQVGQDR